MPNFNGLWTSRQQMQARGGNTWPSVPGAPTSPVATAGNQSASVAFVAPSDTGFPAGITGYRVTSSPGGFTGTGLTSPVTVTGLTNGTAYTFTVAAQNVNGYGPESVASNSVTPVLPNYIEDVFSTTLYVGNGSSQTVTDNIDLSTKGGMVWIKGRNAAEPPVVVDTVRGASEALRPSSTAASINNAGRVSAFTTSGFTVGSDGETNGTNTAYVSWAFREQAKFFDVVTWTGNGSARTIAHNLGSTPGCIIIKCLNTTFDWIVWHRSMAANNYNAFLNTTDAAGAYGVTSSTAPTSTDFSLTTSPYVNQNGSTYVAYVFAHNAGGFGASSSENVISCGSYTGNGAAGGQLVNLGYEAQWVMIKQTNASGSGWWMMDVMRGYTVNGDYGGDASLDANTNAAEANQVLGQPSALGFTPIQDNVNQSGQTYIYIAIRRGPMAVPTDATKVFEPVTTSNGTIGTSVPVKDVTLNFTLASTAGWQMLDRLRGLVAGFTSNTSGNTAANPFLITNSNAVEASSGSRVGGLGIARAIGQAGTWYNGDTGALGNGNFDTLYTLQRSPGFMDVVCAKGTLTSNQRISHNLTVVPELIIEKGRDRANYWVVYFGSINTRLYLNTTDSVVTIANTWGTSPPTTTDFGINSGSIDLDNFNGVFYLFATCPGVSKVGTYTGTGATQTIACGFAAGARFVMIKRTDSTGDWYVWDTVRGMVSGTNPSLLLNTAAAQVNTNSVYTITTGFQIVSTAAGINASGGTYIFLAIA